MSDAAPALGRRKSFYDLEFWVAPGGAHMDAHYIRGTLDEIQRDLANELNQSISLYLLCWYGAELNLCVFQNGDLTRSIDLHPYITIRPKGFPEITFDSRNVAQGHDFKGDDVDDDNSLTSRLFDGTIPYQVNVAWDRMDVPALQGEIVQADDLVNISDEWRLVDKYPEWSRQDLLSHGFLPYGMTDREAC